VKENLKTLVILFAGNLVLLYFFGTDRDIAGMFFVSAVGAAIVSLMSRHVKRYTVNIINKITVDRLK
jgi:uncharacterized membrane protein YjjP (DUF1212 family)